MGQGMLFGREGEHRLARLLLIPCNQRLSNRQLAKLLGVTKDTVQKHKAAALALMEGWQLQPVSEEDLRGIERALVIEAQAGNVSAAKILFERVKAATAAAVPPDHLLPTVAELEAALALLKGTRI